jgi:mono/diheme cytochrome c family protein
MNAARLSTRMHFCHLWGTVGTAMMMTDDPGSSRNMSKALNLLSAAYCFFVIITPSVAADASHGKDIAKRWCASCHLIEPRQTSVTDIAPPFSDLSKMPDFDEKRLAFLLLIPHPSMPNVSLNRADVSDLADYIGSLK